MKLLGKRLLILSMHRRLCSNICLHCDADQAPTVAIVLQILSALISMALLSEGEL